MIWLIGNKGMLGHDIKTLLEKSNFPLICSDMDVDITDYSNLEAFSRGNNIQWIINASAYTAVDKAEDEAEAAFLVNEKGAANIAEIARKLGAKLIHFSTDYVFDGEKDGDYYEDDPVNPIGIYGKSKLAGEKKVLAGCDKHFIIRISWLFGRNGNNFVYTMLKLFDDRDEINVVSDQYGSPTYTKSTADLVMRIIRSESTDYGIYHFANEGITNWHEFAATIYQMAKDKGKVSGSCVIHSIPASEYPTKAQRPHNSSFSKDKVKKTFNIPIAHWKEALSDFLDETDMDKGA